MKLSLSVFGSTTSTVEAPRGAQYSRLSGPAQIPLFSLPCFLPLRPPVPEPVNGGRRCRACGAFRRPPLAVRRACLRRRALGRVLARTTGQACRPSSEGTGVRRTTPPRGRTDPFQGPKTKPMLYRFSNVFQDDFGVENGGQNGGNIGVKSCQETLLEPGGQAMRFSEALGNVLGIPGTSKIVRPLQCGPNFC